MSKNSFNTMNEVVSYLRNAGIEAVNFNGWRVETPMGIVALNDSQLLVNFQPVSKKSFDIMIAVTKKNQEEAAKNAALTPLVSDEISQ